MMPDNNYIVFNEKQANEYLKMNLGDDFTLARNLSFGIENRKKTFVILDDSLSNKTVTIDIENCEMVEIDAVFLKSVESAKVIVNIGKLSAIHGIFCEVSHLLVDLTLEINLLSDSATADINVATIALEKASKQFHININHLAPNTTSNVVLKGICKDASQIKFFPTSTIAENTILCEVYQESRIINLSDESHGIIKPTLLINNNEVKAKHSAALGNVKHDEIFYLLSRGLDENVARYLIVRGLVSSVFSKLPNIDEKKKFEIVFERGITHA